MKKRISISLIAASMALGVSAGAFFNSKKATEEVLAAPSRTYTNGDKATYYSGIDSSKSGNDLLADLRSLNLGRRKSTVGYNSMGTTADGQFKYTDYDPDTVKYDSNGQPYGTKILSFYSGKSTTSFNREHVWPNSRGGGSKGGAGSPYPDADIFMPRPTIAAENSDRGNSVYVEGMCHSSNGWDPVTAFETSMGVYPGIRGECARIVFYCMTVNSKLTLNDNISNDRTNMGKLTDLLRWNIEYGVNAREENRNEGGEYLQGNRNAFVDHPEYACKIWGNTNDKTKQICGSQQVTLSSIILSGNYKTSFEVNDSFTYSGLVVTAHYTDGSSKTITPTSVSTPSMSSAGSETIIVSYTEGSITKTASYNIVVSAGGSTTDSHTTSLTLNKTTASVTVGSSTTLVATKIPVDSVDPINWSTSSSAIATVNNGVVTGVKAGTAVITATSNGIEATCSVTVKAQSTGGDTATAHVEFNHNNTTWTDEIGNTWTGNGSCSGSASYLHLKQDGIVTSSIISVDTSQSIIGSVGLGTYGGKTSGVKTQIYAINSSGKTVTNVVECGPTDSNKKSFDFTLTFADASDSNIQICFATPNSTNSVYIRFYSASVTYTPAGSGTQSVPVTGVSLNKTSLSLNVGSNETLTATVSPSNADNKNVGWTSSNPSVATVSNGTVCALSVGTTTITVSTEDGNKTATCNITVESGNVDVTGVSLNDSSKTLVVGGSFTLTATVAPSNATNKNVTWSSSNPSVASVNNGTVTALSSGTTTITVKTAEGNKTATCLVTVNAQVINVTDVELDTNHLDLEVGGTDGTLIATVSPSNASIKEVTWNSSNTSVATVEDGVVHAVGNGSAIITVKTVDGDFIDQCTVAVTTPEVIVHPESVSLNINSKSINEGETFSLIATILPENATNKNVSWESSDSSIATVDDGYIKGLNAGTAVITVKTQVGNHTASCTVTVNSITPPPPVEDKVMTELVINKMPNKTIYKVGERFEQEGLEVSVNYLDGSSAKVRSFAIPTKPDASTAGTKTVKVYYNENGKTVSAAFDVLYLEDEATIVSISKANDFAKTEYYVGDELLLLGLKVNGTLSDGSIVDVTDLVDISCDLSSVGSKEVTISLGGVNPIVTNVTVKEGEPTSQEEAMDFVYEYEYKVSEVTEDVTKAQWLVLEHYYNTLDEDAKNVLKSVVTEYSSGVSAGNDNKINEIIKNYDEVIIAKKASGFNDFMGRNPKAVEPANNNNTISITTIIVIAAIAVVVIGFCIIFPIIIKSKAKKRA